MSEVAAFYERVVGDGNSNASKTGAEMVAATNIVCALIIIGFPSVVAFR